MAASEPHHDPVTEDTGEASGKQKLIRLTSEPSSMARTGEMYRYDDTLAAQITNSGFSCD